jgi:hypothetical protein
MSHISSVSMKKNKSGGCCSLGRRLSDEKHVEQGAVKGANEEIFIWKTKHGRDRYKHSRVGGLFWVVQQLVLSMVNYSYQTNINNSALNIQ